MNNESPSSRIIDSIHPNNSQRTRLRSKSGFYFEALSINQAHPNRATAATPLSTDPNTPCWLAHLHVSVRGYQLVYLSIY